MGSITRAIRGAALVLAAVTVAGVTAEQGAAETEARTKSSTASVGGVDLSKLGIPFYPGMVRIVASNPPTEANATATGTPTLASFDTFVTEDRFEEVVRFYQAGLRLSPVSAHPKDLAATFPGQPVPTQSRGRRSVFRLGTTPDPQQRRPLAEQILTRALGHANVVISDFAVDPRTKQLTGQTSIVVLVYR